MNDLYLWFVGASLGVMLAVLVAWFFAWLVGDKT
jgi:high-affinity Fe2+/Pb2+ permease